MKRTFILCLATGLAAFGIWWLGHSKKTVTADHERKILFYQSAMHPWVKSDKPGRCTICGMELTPVYADDNGMETDSGIVSLDQNMVRVLNVETAEARMQPLAKSLSFAGMVDDNARQHRVISAYLDGRIEKLYVNYPGAEVEEGKPLAEIYSPTLLQAEREYRASNGDLRQNVASRLRQLGLTPRQIAALPDKSPNEITSEILSPISGTVATSEIYAGQYVTAGQRLFELADFSTMWFVFPVYETDIAWVKPGQNVEITTPSVPGKTFHGKVDFIDPNFDAMTRSTSVRVELPNPLVNGRRVLFHRLYGDAKVFLDAPEVLAVPRSAIIETGPEAVVYLVQKEGRYLRKTVALGMRGDIDVEISSGLNPGDRVVTNGNLLIDGQAEITRSFSAQPAASTENARTLTEPQSTAVKMLVQALDAVAAGLATDDLTAFNEAAPKLTPAAQKIVSAFGGRADSAEALQNFAASQSLHDAANLQTARKMFYAFSTASEALLSPLRSEEMAPAFEVFECPMTNGAVPGVPKKGRWIQAAGTEIRNPYFGTAMLDCGARIEP